MCNSYILEKLGAIKSLTNALESELLSDPTNPALVLELIKACEDIDERYQDWCYENDADEGLEPGTTYEKNDCFMEFYIDSDLWARASVALRNLAKNSKK